MTSLVDLPFCILFIKFTDDYCNSRPSYEWAVQKAVSVRSQPPSLGTMAKGGALPGFFAAGGRRFRAGGSSRYDRRRYASAYQDASAQDGPGCVQHHHPLEDV